MTSDRSSHEMPHEVLADVLFFDCEATGLDAESNQVIEIGIISGTGERVLSERAKPLRALPPRIVELTGISDNDLSNAQTESALLAKIHPVLSSARALGGYFVHLDYGYLQHAYTRAGMGGQFSEISSKPFVCAKTLARVVTPEIGLDFSLTDLCRLLNIPTLTHHSAIDDAAMSQLATHALLTRARVRSFEGLFSLQGAIVQSPWEIPSSSEQEKLLARKRWQEFVVSTTL